jgi:hypothetical protein
MEFTSEQLVDLEGLLWRAAEDFQFQEEFLADPVGVIARDTGVQLPAGDGFRVVFSSDADLTLVMPIPPGSQGGAAPSVVFPDYDTVELDLDEFADLAQSIPGVVSRWMEDADFRAWLTSEPKAALADCCETAIRHDIQFVDPQHADYTVILPTRDATGTSRPVICVPVGSDASNFGLPGVTVHTFGQPEAAGELSDEALEAVVGGTGGKSSGPIGSTLSAAGSAVGGFVSGGIDATKKTLGLP